MVKYRITYYDLKNNGWGIELSNLSYSGPVVNLNTTQGNGANIIYTGSDDMNEPVVVSSCKFTVLKHQLGLIDVEELKNSYDRDWSVDVYKNGALFWTGYLVPDGILEYYQSQPYDVELTATDGLKLLQGTKYSTNNWPLPVGVENRSFISHIRDILFLPSQLGKPLPIRWVGDLKRMVLTVPTDDAFTQCLYSPHGEGYTDFNGIPYSSYFILDNYLRALDSRIYQCFGKWRIERIPDVKTGTFDWSEIDTTFDPVDVPVLTTGTETRLQEIGTEFIVDDGAYTMNVAGIKKVTTTYQENKSENSLPNGTFDTGPLQPLQWYGRLATTQVQQVDSINGRAGSSVEISFPDNASGSDDSDDFAMRNGVGGTENKLPIDTATMYKRMSIGFTLMPQNGFPFDTTTGNIQWDLSPFQFRIELTAIGTTNKVYTLNENGFWIPKPNGSNFNRFSQNKTFINAGGDIVIDSVFEGSVMVGDNITHQVGTAAVVTVFCPQINSGDIQGFLDYTGQSLIDAGVITSYTVSSQPSNRWLLSTQEPSPVANASLYKLEYALSNTARDGSIRLLPGDAKIGDVIQVNFDKFQGIKLPDFADDPSVTHVEFNWFFYVFRGQKYTLDDVYVKFDDNSEVYEYEYESSKMTETLDYTTRIGSSTNGFYTTNVMDSFSQSFNQSLYIDSLSYVGTLADISTRNRIKLRSKSLKLFEGKLNGDNWEFGTLFTINGYGAIKFLPLSATYNTELCEIQLSCMEMNVGDDSFTRRFYGSNDKPLSNEIIN